MWTTMDVGPISSTLKNSYKVNSQHSQCHIPAVRHGLSEPVLYAWSNINGRLRSSWEAVNRRITWTLSTSTKLMLVRDDIMSCEEPQHTDVYVGYTCVRSICIMDTRQPEFRWVHVNGFNGDAKRHPQKYFRWYSKLKFCSTFCENS